MSGDVLWFIASADVGAQMDAERSEAAKRDECRHHVPSEDRCPDCEASDLQMAPEHFDLLEAAEMIANDFKDDCLNGSEYVAVSRMGFNCLMEVLKAQTSARVGR